MAFTYRNTVLRTLNYAESDGNFAEMERMYTAALNAELVATAAANIYVDTTAGLAATAEGGYFTVPDTSTDELVIYREVAGVATEQIRFGRPFVGGVLTSALDEAPPVTIASAATVNIGAAASNTVIVSGTATITAFDTIAAGAIRYIRATGAFTLTHNATTLIIPGGANIVAAVGDVFRFESLGGGNWRMTGFASGTSRPALLSAVNTFIDGQNVGTGSGNASARLNGGAGSTRYLDFASGGSLRARLLVSAVAESGANAGSDPRFDLYDDAGALITNAIQLKRSTGAVILGTPTGSYQGANTLNAVNLYVQGSAVLKQSEIFVSTDQTITLAGALTIAHGLGAVPRAVKLALVCQTAELGYSVGDVVMDVSARTVASIVVDATNLNIRYFDSANVLIVNKTTGARTGFAVANWKARFRAIK